MPRERPPDSHPLMLTPDNARMLPLEELREVFYEIAVEIEDEFPDEGPAGFAEQAWDMTREEIVAAVT